jgi:hypothetical protein
MSSIFFDCNKFRNSDLLSHLLCQRFEVSENLTLTEEHEELYIETSRLPGATRVFIYPNLLSDKHTYIHLYIYIYVYSHICTKFG